MSDAIQKPIVVCSRTPPPHFLLVLVVAVKVCQASLYQMYEDKRMTYNSNKLLSFTNFLDCGHGQIQIKWIIDLNDNSAMLSFIYHGEHIQVEYKGLIVDCKVWATLLAKVKLECTRKSNLPSAINLLPCLKFFMYSCTSHLLHEY